VNNNVAPSATNTSTENITTMSRGVQNVLNMDSHLALWIFPLFSTIISGKNFFRHLAFSEHPPLATPFWTRKYKEFTKIYKGNLGVLESKEASGPQQMHQLFQFWLNNCFKIKFFEKRVGTYFPLSILRILCIFAILCNTLSF
jgi:hypothetical protein